MLSAEGLGLAAKLERLSALRERRRVTGREFSEAKRSALAAAHLAPRVKDLTYLRDIIQDQTLVGGHFYI